MDEAVGFCKVIHKISESKKIVVGHNMFLDILYTLQQFVAPLPEDYDEFKVIFLFLNLSAKNSTSCLNRGWCIKFATRLLFCQNVFPMGGIIFAKGQLDHSYIYFLNYAYNDI